MTYLLIVAAAYVLGSIPFGLLVGKWWAKVDVRNYGSGNIGMTNVLRTAGYIPALLTLIGDVGKGAAAVLLARRFLAEPIWSLVAGMFAMIGHNWPLFLGFKGGKGVATVAGVLAVFRPPAALILFLTWLAVLLAFRYISLASITVAVCLPLVLLLLGAGWFEVLLGVLVGAITVYRHRSNIERLRKGTEFRFGEKVQR
ncbi:MAG: glycerol-3-phosphate 1-O-acyltransferase PlsY [Limnochordia bacterium]|jgi:glycerol-3-phosphate acyltransferase PlsY|nr:glycerol-3-phosphate 1-O-acyltransferase PlsY [Limnochordia bacterium]MDI9464317.1 glycerol-3-phosphate 1-O-acyltransferase PlsY [Bacillota bacterium]NLO94857.1 glycerol-3-phosphate 1-O-acyltransferase PlsY [Bacillota bacterium]HOB40241.1 glycerol-3-phosphate 1-O-acyltransferase PlsY [Limnochordia bacterium]HOK30638.1 glycerol-3-phosphate 1-O-acyltransferase PlsY [Limnochordia bacterium]